MKKKEPEQDRNFDDLAPRFQRKVYGGAKGRIRLAVLEKDFQEFFPAAVEEAGERPLRILDAGGGTGPFSMELARLGHEVTICDLSRKMLDQAIRNFSDEGLEDRLHTVCGPIQELAPESPFDLVLCHAVLEWVKDPEAFIFCLMNLTAGNGILSLVFYNLTGLVYKNLLRTNYRKVLEQDYLGYPGSLTPTWPRRLGDVLAWLAVHPFDILCHSGIRVFHDYILDPRDRDRDMDSVLELELSLSREMPYRDLGRFVHLLGQKRA